MIYDYEDCLLPNTANYRVHHPAHRPMIYVAGYYSHNPAHGIRNAADAWNSLLEMGWLPIVPHTTFLVDMLYPQTPAFWYAYDMAILARCDAIYVCQDTITSTSVGVGEEIRFAWRNNIPVFNNLASAREAIIMMEPGQ